jgi:hypothetical protein
LALAFLVSLLFLASLFGNFEKNNSATQKKASALWAKARKKLGHWLSLLNSNVHQ